MKPSLFLIVLIITCTTLLASCSGTKYTVTTTHEIPSATKAKPPVITDAPDTHSSPQQLDISKKDESELQKKYAQLLDVKPSSILDFKLYQFIDDWYHVPYKYAGRSRSGVDCSDFVSLLLDSVYDITFEGSSASMFTKTTPVKKEELQEGDLVFFKIAKNRISHIGFYLANHKFVHASVANGIIISDLDEAYYKKYFYSGGRLTSN